MFNLELRWVVSGVVLVGLYFIFASWVYDDNIPGNNLNMVYCADFYLA